MQPRIGDYICFSLFRWGCNDDVFENQANSPIWGQAANNEHFYYICGGTNEFQCDVDYNEPITFYEPSDKWTIVDVEDLPDHVLTVIAVKALTE